MLDILKTDLDYEQMYCPFLDEAYLCMKTKEQEKKYIFNGGKEIYIKMGRKCSVFSKDGCKLLDELNKIVDNIKQSIFKRHITSLTDKELEQYFHFHNMIKQLNISSYEKYLNILCTYILLEKKQKIDEEYWFNDKIDEKEHEQEIENLKHERKNILKNIRYRISESLAIKCLGSITCPYKNLFFDKEVNKC